jgi:hypothetical protein
MNIELSAEQWKPIDEWILRGWVINAMRAIREAAGVGIREATDIYHERYNMLRESRPEEFVHEQGEDRKEFYSQIIKTNDDFNGLFLPGP